LKQKESMSITDMIMRGHEMPFEWSKHFKVQQPEQVPRSPFRAL
jgi:hypothetical protein